MRKTTKEEEKKSLKLDFQTMARKIKASGEVEKSVKGIRTNFTTILYDKFLYYIHYGYQIMKVDLAQQKEIEDEENAEMNSITSVFSAASALTSEEEKRLIEEEDDVDDFDDISIMIDVNKDDDKLFESFFIKDLPPQCTLVDIIFKKFKDNESRLAEDSYFIKTLLEKIYCMPYRVFDALVAHFMRFVDEISVMLVI
ncbi:hypothetical protein YC2023_083325 [Brassica napus]